jgi:Flp pilus assembly protein TadG
MKRQRGSSLLEMALLMPIFLTLCIGTIELAIGFYVKFFVQYASTSAAMFLAAKNPPGLVYPYVRGLANGMGLSTDNLTVNFSHAPFDMSSCPDSALPVVSWCARVTDKVQLAIPFVNVGLVTLQAAAQAPEQPTLKL